MSITLLTPSFLKSIFVYHFYLKHPLTPKTIFTRVFVHCETVLVLRKKWGGGGLLFLGFIFSHFLLSVKLF